jgi:hypothetical protein
MKDVSGDFHEKHFVDVCSFSLEASTGHDTPDLGGLPVVSLYNEGGVFARAWLSLYP